MAMAMAARNRNRRREELPGANNIAFTSWSFSSYNSQQQEERQSLSVYHAIYGFALPILINFIKLYYQGLDSTPFETHPKTMLISIAGLLLYSLAYEYEQSICTLTAYAANALLCGAVVLGSLPLVCLASVISPRSISPLLFFLHALFSAMVTVQFGVVQVVPWNYIQQRMRGHRATPQRRIGRAVTYPGSSGRISSREGLPV